MIEIKKLKKQGTKIFKSKLKELKRKNSDKMINIGDNFMVNVRKDLGKKIMLEENKSFSNKFELGKYLNQKLKPAKTEKIVELEGLWNWLSYLWFDQICPVNNNGTRKIYEMSRYIYDGDRRKYYRQIMLASWYIFSKHQENSKVMLYNPLYQIGDMHEQLAARQEVFSNEGLIETAYKLYWDKENDHLKTGATSYEGGVRDLIIVADQLDLTYDIRGMTSNDIIDLLPEEFDKWLE